MNVLFAALMFTLGAGEAVRLIQRLDSKEWSGAFFAFVLTFIMMRFGILSAMGKL